MSNYTEIQNCTETEIAAINACARGCYQRYLLAGNEAWSGATLQGTAASYGYWYARSRRNLMTRLGAVAGVTVREERRAHGKRVVVITGSATQAVAA